MKNLKKMVAVAKIFGIGASDNGRAMRA